MNSSPKKLSATMLAVVSILALIGMGLFGLNYWHASKCASDRSPDEVEEMVAALKNRLLESESKILKNEIMMNKLIHSMQSNLFRLEQSEYTQLVARSNSEAVEIALLLASHPAPPMPIFPLDPQFADAESLANKVDDIIGNGIQGGEYYEELNAKTGDTLGDQQLKTLSDAESTRICTEWRDKYSVKVGVSWGELPYDLQQKWLEYSCDYHMKSDSISSFNDNNEQPDAETGESHDMAKAR